MKQDQQFEKLAFRIKLKRWLFTILLIVILFPVLAMVGYKATQSLAARQSTQLMSEMDTRQSLMSPNIQISDLMIGNSNVGGGTIVSHQYKDIDGYRIPWQTVQGKYNWAYHEMQSNNLVDSYDSAAYTRATQTKIPLFYNNTVESPNVKKVSEIKSVSTMKDYVGEVALTFRQPLTYKQILRKLPSGIQANWFWLGVSGRADPTIENNNFLGIQSTSGKLAPSDYKIFSKDLREANDLGTINNFSLTHYAHQYAKKYPSLNRAKFAGVIVTGKTENFKPLRNQTWITESSVGTTIKRVPYIKPSF